MRSIKKQGGWIASHGGADVPHVITISGDQTILYHMFNAAGSPTTPGRWIFVIASGVVLQNGLDTDTAWPTGTTLSVVNHGTIAGIGGAGAAGDTTGTAGGVAINLQHDLSLDNTDGFIFGGGGGGGGGGFATSSDKTHVAKSGGGGGGRGYNNASGGPVGSFGNTLGTATAGSGGSSAAAGGGGSGTTTGDATSGGGGAGGDWATAGASGTDGISGGQATGAGGAGGAAGRAVTTNGFTLTQVAGFDGPTGTHVKGAIV